MHRELLVIIEHANNQVSQAMWQLAAKAREYAASSNFKLSALLFGYHLDMVIKEVSKMGFETIFMADNSLLEEYNPESYVNALSKMLLDVSPHVVLLGDSYFSRELAPAIAFRLRAPYLNSCLNLKLMETRAEVIQSKYGGAILLRSELEPLPHCTIFGLQASPYFEIQSITKSSTIVNMYLAHSIQGQRTKVAESVISATGEFDLSKADIVVSGGRGLGRKENFKLVEELAESLDGAFACSRPLCDLGYLPIEYLVGMSGKTIAPKVYVACGISGAPQHIAGILNAKRIIAINKDANAPIFKYAHFGVVGDVLNILPAVIQAVRGNKRSPQVGIS